MAQKQRELVNRTRVSTSIDKELVEKLEELYVKELKKRVPKSKLYDEALELLLEKYDIQFSKDE